MAMPHRGYIGILACDSGRHFAEKVASKLEKIVSPDERAESGIMIDPKNRIFADDDPDMEILACVRDMDVYVFQDLANQYDNLSKNDREMALYDAINAATMSGALNVTAVTPVFPSARQHKRQGRVGLRAWLKARFMETAGAKTVITLDVHNESIHGFFKDASTRLENIRASLAFLDYISTMIKGKTGYELHVASPDVGGTGRAKFYAQCLETNLVVLDKTRDYNKTNTVKGMNLVGEVKDRDIFIIDDMIDTAGTLKMACQKLKDHGAKNIYFGASLLLLNERAVEKIDEAYDNKLINKVMGTNVIYRDDRFRKDHQWYEELHLENFFAQAIYNINHLKSVGNIIDIRRKIE